MARRHGLQAEVLASLSLVMLTASLVFVGVLVATHEAGVGRLHPLAARALLDDARAPLPTAHARVPGLLAWEIERGGAVYVRGEEGRAIDAETRALADEARARGVPLWRSGFPWQPARFAAPLEDRVVAVRLPPVVSGWLVLGLLLADGVVFTAFGASLLQRRLVLPLQRLAAATRALAAGELSTRVVVEGPRETVEVAGCFNEMSEALESRTEALEKAVLDLRRSNEELRSTRAELDRSERLASVGRLAAGVAHEVGNPLGAILAFADLVRRDPGLSDASREQLSRVQTEGRRVRGILGQLLDFSRPRRPEVAPLDLAALAEETAGLLRAQRRYAEVRIAVAAEGAPPAALGDRGAVVQILLNLLLNACEALVAAGAAEPRVTVRVAAAGAGGDAVECRVADNGPGIPPEHRERIFDPFFTTRDPGQGTGLGLPNALRGAEEMGGGLVLEDADEGAVFVLRLPAAPAERGGARPTRDA